MCPDAELLSAYRDGEVPSPWKERLASHVEVCPSCARRLSSYESLGRTLRGAGEPALDGLTERLLARAREEIESAEGAGKARRLSRSRAAPGVWSRRVSLPLPIAAAAAAVLVFFAGIAFSAMLRPAQNAFPGLAAAPAAPSIEQGASMEALLRYLEAQNAQVSLTIQLPSSTPFDAAGSPVIVTAPPLPYTPYVLGSEDSRSGSIALPSKPGEPINPEKGGAP